MRMSLHDAMKIASLSPFAKGNGERVAEIISYLVLGEKKCEEIHKKRRWKNMKINS